MLSKNESSNIIGIKLMLDSLCIYRNLLNDAVIGRFHTLLEYTAGLSYTNSHLDSFVKLYAEFFNSLASCRMNLNFYEYIAEKIIFDENPFTSNTSTLDQSFDVNMGAAVRNDLETLQYAASLSSSTLKSYCSRSNEYNGIYESIIQSLPDWNNISYEKIEISVNGTPSAYGIKETFISSDNWSECYTSLKQFHEKNGYGAFAHYNAFIWQRSNSIGRLVPINNPDPVRLSDLIDYETERQEVVKNTENFLNGYPANNILLYGDRGTGKSSTVKAILNEYHSMGLRVIEVPKNLLVDFPEIVSGLSCRNHKFILFVDDLAFEDKEENYTALKAVLEGSLEIRPQNVLIYATSNRRHLIKEKFSERGGLQYGDKDDEIRAYDTMQEKLSLSDRFGITVVFSSPDKKRFLHIVDELADRKGIEMDKEELHKEALKWELWYNGRSPRTAQQFISWLKGNIK